MRTIKDIIRDLRTAAYAEGDGGIGLSDLADKIEAADEGHCDDCKTCHADADCEYFSKIVKIVIAHAESHKEVKHD